MTTSKQLETISGAVEQINSKGTGIKVLGEWLNVSQYHTITPMPVSGQVVGAHVELTDKGPWSNSLRLIGAAAPSSTTSPSRDREIRRLACLKAAATFCGGKALNTDVKTADVLKVAEAFERWILVSEED